MITLGTISLDEVMCLVALGAPRAPVLDDEGNRWMVKICDSQRIKVFARSHKCVSCERAGHHFRLERHGEENPHLNLYSEDGVLMTKDHIVPKAKGGKNYMSNYQTMCYDCNQEKGASHE